MSVQPRVRTEHLIKIHKELEDKRHFGSLLIHYQDGKISAITTKADMNPAAVIEHCENALNRVVIRKSKVRPVVDDAEKYGELPKTAENCRETAENSNNESGSLIRGKDIPEEVVAINRESDAQDV